MERESFVTIAEAVRLTGLSRNTILRRIKAGELHAEKAHPAYRKGARLRIPRSQVEALVRPQG